MNNTWEKEALAKYFHIVTIAIYHRTEEKSKVIAGEVVHERLRPRIRTGKVWKRANGEAFMSRQRADSVPFWILLEFSRTFFFPAFISPLNPMTV